MKGNPGDFVAVTLTPEQSAVFGPAILLFKDSSESTRTGKQPASLVSLGAITKSCRH
jgi:hypothetical protein